MGCGNDDAFVRCGVFTGWRSGWHPQVGGIVLEPAHSLPFPHPSSLSNRAQSSVISTLWTSFESAFSFHYSSHHYFLPSLVQWCLPRLPDSLLKCHLLQVTSLCLAMYSGDSTISRQEAAIDLSRNSVIWPHPNYLFVNSLGNIY